MLAGEGVLWNFVSCKRCRNTYWLCFGFFIPEIVPNVDGICTNMKRVFACGVCMLCPILWWCWIIFKWRRFFWSMFLGRAMGFLKMEKSGPVRDALHSLKYRHQPQVGAALGKWWAQKIEWQYGRPNWDVMITVPLTPEEKEARLQPMWLYCKAHEWALEHSIGAGCIDEEKGKQESNLEVANLAQYNRAESIWGGWPWALGRKTHFVAWRCGDNGCNIGAVLQGFGPN